MSAIRLELSLNPWGRKTASGRTAAFNVYREPSRLRISAIGGFTAPVPTRIFAAVRQVGSQVLRIVAMMSASCRTAISEAARLGVRSLLLKLPVSPSTCTNTPSRRGTMLRPLVLRA